MIIVTIWICEDCGSYYASSGAGDLSTNWNYDAKGKQTFPRARCPTMTCAAKETMRKPFPIVIQDSHDMQQGEVLSLDDLPKWLGRPCLTCGKPLIGTGNLVICSGCNKMEAA